MPGYVPRTHGSTSRRGPERSGAAARTGWWAGDPDRCGPHAQFGRHRSYHCLRRTETSRPTRRGALCGPVRHVYRKFARRTCDAEQTRRRKRSGGGTPVRERAGRLVWQFSIQKSKQSSVSRARCSSSPTWSAPRPTIRVARPRSAVARAPPAGRRRRRRAGLRLADRASPRRRGLQQSAEHAGQRVGRLLLQSGDDPGVRRGLRLLRPLPRGHPPDLDERLQRPRQHRTRPDDQRVPLRDRRLPGQGDHRLRLAERRQDRRHDARSPSSRCRSLGRSRSVWSAVRRSVLFRSSWSGPGSWPRPSPATYHAHSSVNFVGFVDDNPLGRGDVLGALEDLPELCREYGVATWWSASRGPTPSARPRC